IERFDGSAWSAVPSPNQGTANNSLNGVSVIPGVGWAVGYYQVGNTYQPLALRWDGTQWSLNSPSVFPDDTVFTSVDTLADGSAWAVGFQTLTDGNRQTLIENAPAGGSWTPGPSLNAAGSADNTLMSIGGTPATGLWAVGYFLSPHGLKPLLLRYNTALRTPRWVRLGQVPSPGTVETVLTGVDALAPNDAWAVGYYDNGSGKQPLALHWDGTSWTSSPVPGTGILRKVKESGPGNVWATGTYY